MNDPHPKKPAPANGERTSSSGFIHVGSGTQRWMLAIATLAWLAWVAFLAGLALRV